YVKNDFQLDRGAERKACDSIHQAARALGFANDVLQQWPTQPRAFPSTCSVNRGGVQNLVCLVHRSSFLTIKPDVLQRNNWTKVLATLWYQPAYPVAFDDPRRHSAALQHGPRRRCDRSPIAAGPFRQNIHELQFIDPVLCLPARGRITP